MEVLTGIDPPAATIKPNKFNQSRFLTNVLKCFFRLFTVFVIVVLAIVGPGFELISAIMGAAFCFTICVMLPAAFHLKMFGNHIIWKQKLWDSTLVMLSAVLGGVGTVWEFLPRDWMALDE